MNSFHTLIVGVRYTLFAVRVKTKLNYLDFFKNIIIMLIIFSNNNNNILSIES